MMLVFELKEVVMKKKPTKYLIGKDKWLYLIYLITYVSLKSKLILLCMLVGTWTCKCGSSKPLSKFQQRTNLNDNIVPSQDTTSLSLNTCYLSSKGMKNISIFLLVINHKNIFNMIRFNSLMYFNQFLK